MKLTDILIYFYEKKTGVYLKTEYAKELPYSNGKPLVPDNATLQKPEILNSPFTFNGLKPIDWRKQNKVSIYIVDDELHDKGHWEERFYIPEPLFKTDKEGFFTKEIDRDLLYKTLPKYPTEAPHNIKLPKWNAKKKSWEETDKVVHIFDDNRFEVERKMLSELSDSDKKNYTEISKPPGLFKGKFDGKKWVEGALLADVKKERIKKLQHKNYEMEHSIHWLMEREQSIEAWNKVCESWSPPEKKKKSAMTGAEMETYLKLRFAIGDVVSKIEKSIIKAKNVKEIMAIELKIDIDLSPYARF